MSTEPIPINGPAAVVTTADTLGDVCFVSDIHGGGYIPEGEWVAVDRADAIGTSRWVFTPCAPTPASIPECGQIYPPGPPCSTVPESSTTVPGRIVSVGNDADLTNGVLMFGSLFLVVGLFAAVAARRRRTEMTE